MIEDKYRVRFFAKIKKLKNGCWEYQGSKSHNGYGRFRYKEKSHQAHRFSYRLFVGEIGRLLVLHRCDNPPCVNPKHLFLGTSADNRQDALRKGRVPTGDKHWSKRYPEKIARGKKQGLAKLTDDDIRSIRKEYRPVYGSLPPLAKKYGVFYTTIHKIVNNLTWKHVK